MKIAIHVTHEAIKKIGGIGTVLNGLITQDRYKKIFSKTLLYSPMFYRSGPITMRLGDEARLLYSGIDYIGEERWAKKFKPIEERCGVKIAYGKKYLRDGNGKAEVDIVTVDIWEMPVELVNSFKYELWKYFNLESDKFQYDHDYEQYLRIAIPLIDIFEAIYGKENPVVLFSHEYMGICSALAIEMAKKEERRKGDVTIFYAHEVSTARAVVEKHQGHDLAFYNVMDMDMKSGVSLEETFGSYANFSRNELVKRARFLDYTFTVSKRTGRELVYLEPRFDTKRIHTVYNGIPVCETSFEEKMQSRKIIKNYLSSLIGFEPDYIFTHVARLVRSKAFWRDINILFHLDEHLTRLNKSGCFIILSTLVGDGRRSKDIERMEAEYGWPISHREGWPDLTGDEIELYKQLEIFNATSKKIKGIFINQFGFAHGICGKKVPKEASLEDLRRASDIEFGLSIYEPFGIAQLETIPYGGVAVISSVCGSSEVVMDTLDDRDYLIIDFTAIPKDLCGLFKNKSDFLNLTQAKRDEIERRTCRDAIGRILKILPKDDKERKIRFERLKAESKNLSWKNVVERILQIL